MEKADGKLCDEWDEIVDKLKKPREEVTDKERAIRSQEAEPDESQMPPPTLQCHY